MCFRTAVQACDEDCSFVPNMAFVEALRLTAVAYSASKARNHPGVAIHLERALGIERSLGLATDPIAAKVHAGCEAHLSELYLNEGRTTESFAAADRGRALLATPGCMDVTLFCELTTYYSLGLTVVGKLDEAMDALARAKVLCALPPGCGPLYEKELYQLVRTEGNVFLHMKKYPQAVERLFQALTMAERLHGPDSN